MRLIRRSAAVITSVVMLGIGMSNAAADDIWVFGETFRVTMRAATFDAGSGPEISCPVTLQGTFTAATFVASSRARIGSVTGSTLGTCTGGTATVLTGTLPWSLQYDSYSGSLPEVSSMNVRVVGASFALRDSEFGSECLIASEESEPIKLRFLRRAAGDIREARFDESAAIRLRNFPCSIFGRGTLSGSGTTSLAGAGTEDPAIFVNTILTALRRSDDTPLGQVGIAANGTGSITIKNRLERELLTLTAAPRSGNTDKFVIESTGTSCWNTIRLLSGADANTCTIRIRRLAGAAQNDIILIELMYRTSLSFPIEVPQYFEVRAT